MTKLNLPRELKTTRLHLRPFRNSDADAVVALCNNYNLYKSTLNLPYPYSPDHFYGWFQTHEQNFTTNKLYTFAIADGTTDEVMGSISLSHIHQHDRGELAYWIGEPYWNKGIATEAAKAILAFAFKNVELNRVFALFFEQNPASGQVMKKIGMTYEGTLRDHLVKDNVHHNTCFYGILKKDYLAKNPLA